MKKLVEVRPGEIYAIPLFLSDRPANENFSREKMDGEDKEFCFCRIIEDQLGSGIIVEVFNIKGNLTTDLESIINSPRLFRPVAIAGLGIYKKRWRKIYTQENYDKENDSLYYMIQLVIGPRDTPRLWQNGTETPITHEQAKDYEPWVVWVTDQLEKRIIQELSHLNSTGKLL